MAGRPSSPEQRTLPMAALLPLTRSCQGRRAAPAPSPPPWQGKSRAHRRSSSPFITPGAPSPGLEDTAGVRDVPKRQVGCSGRQPGKAEPEVPVGQGGQSPRRRSSGAAAIVVIPEPARLPLQPALPDPPLAGGLASGRVFGYRHTGWRFELGQAVKRPRLLLCGHGNWSARSRSGRSSRTGRKSRRTATPPQTARPDPTRRFRFPTPTRTRRS